MLVVSFSNDTDDRVYTVLNEQNQVYITSFMVCTDQLP